MTVQGSLLRSPKRTRVCMEMDWLWLGFVLVNADSSQLEDRLPQVLAAGSPRSPSSQDVASHHIEVRLVRPQPTPYQRPESSIEVPTVEAVNPPILYPPIPEYNGSGKPRHLGSSTAMVRGNHLGKFHFFVRTKQSRNHG